MCVRVGLCYLLMSSSETSANLSWHALCEHVLGTVQLFSKPTTAQFATCASEQFYVCDQAGANLITP